MKPPRSPSCALEPSFPTRPQNRPSLPRLGYRIGTYSDARLAMLYALDRDATLAAWTHRSPDDPGIALLEGAAIVTDILTFYQDLYANEAFLRTATWRESVADLVKLTGYRLAPAIGGTAQFSLQARNNQSVQVPAGFAIKADLAEMSTTSTFETTTTITAQPFLNAFNLFAPLDDTLCLQGTVAFRTDGIGTVKPGDRLLVGDGQPQPPGTLTTSQIVNVDQVSTLHGETQFTIKGALQRGNAHAVWSLEAFKLGRTFKHFGHNAPMQEVRTATGGSGVVAYDVPLGRSMSQVTQSANLVVSTLLPAQFPLDSPIDNWPVGNLLALRSEWQTQGRHHSHDHSWCVVRATVSASKQRVKWGSLASSTTVLGIDSNLATGTIIDGYAIGSLELYEVLQPLVIRGKAAETSLASGKRLFFYGLPAQAAALLGQQLAFVKPGADSYTRTVAFVPDVSTRDPNTPQMIWLRLDSEVDYADFDNENPTVTVYGNLVTATEGKTQASTVLGNGDARATFQTFRVPKAPLTYLVETAVTPPQQPQIQIFVGNRQWQEVDALYGSDANDEVYVVRQDAAGNSWVQFGDGITGARVPSGVGNVAAVWRVGAGSYGPMKPNTTPALAGRLDGLTGVKLPGIVTGGAPAETGDHARQAAPGQLQSLDRLVSLDDFASEALGIGGVLQARADWELFGGVSAVVVSILMVAGREGEADSVRTTLAAYNSSRGPARAPIFVRQSFFQYVYLEAHVTIDPLLQSDSVLVAIKEALGVTGEESNGVDGTGGLFDPAARQLGETEYVSRIEGVIQGVPGVLWTKVTAFGSLGTASDPTTPTPPPTPAALVPQVVPVCNYMLRLFSNLAAAPGANALNLILAAGAVGG